MNMIFTLTKNEYIKLFRKKSVPVLLILLMLLSVGIGLIKPRSNDYYNDRYYISPEEQVNILRQQIFPESNIDNLNEKEKGNIILNNAALREQIKVYEKAIELGVSDRNDWRMQLVESIAQYSRNIYLYEYIQSGGEYADQARGMFGMNYEKEYYSENGKTSYSQAIGGPENFNYDQAKAFVEKGWNAIKENNYSESRRTDYEKAKATAASYKEQLNEFIKSKTDPKVTEVEKKNIELKIYQFTEAEKLAQKIVESYEYMMNNNYKYNSYGDKTVKHAENAFNQAISNYMSIMTEADFEQYVRNNGAFNISINDDYNYEKITIYKEYFDKTVQSIGNTIDKGNIALYSLKNNVEELSVANSSRKNLLNFINMFWFIAPLAIFFASGSVAREYTTKTINLLLIRPVRRWKILLSKYLCIFSLTLVAIISSLLFYMIGTGISMGFADLLQPYLYVTDGVVNSISFIPWILTRILWASVPVMFLITATFMFSTLIKSSSVALILGVISLFSSIFTLFFFGLIENMTVRTYLPFPYFAMWNFAFSGMETVTYVSRSFFLELVRPNVTYGIILLAVLTAFSLIISFSNFNKKDIK